MEPTRHPHSVLVVDDAVDTRNRLCACLSEAGVEVAGCRAERGPALAQLGAMPSGCALTGVPLRDLDAFGLLSELPSRDPHCVVIVIMNNLNEEIRRRCTAARVQHFLDKPTEFERAVELAHALGARP